MYVLQAPGAHHQLLLTFNLAPRVYVRCQRKKDAKSVASCENAKAVVGNEKWRCVGSVAVVQKIVPAATQC